jgi:integrase
VCFAKWLVAKQLVTPTVLEGVASLKPKRFKPARRPKLNKKQVKAFLLAIDNAFSTELHRQRFKLLCQLMAGTGLRAAEVLSLQWQDIDIEGQHLRLVGKGNKPRITVLPKHLGDALVQWKAQHWKGGTGLWNGYTYNAMRCAMQRHIQPRVDFDVTFHALRRTAATFWVEELNLPTAILRPHSCTLKATPQMRCR